MLVEIGGDELDNEGVEVEAETQESFWLNELMRNSADVCAIVDVF
jgi:hypothetical protein